MSKSVMAGATKSKARAPHFEQPRPFAESLDDLCVPVVHAGLLVMPVVVRYPVPRLAIREQ